jgi:arsenite-transporting ATPase
MRKRLQDATQTSFVVVTVPTKLSVAESKRLIHELASQGVSVTDIVINQCVVDMDDSDDGSRQIMEKYYERRVAGQEKWAARLQEAIDEVSASEDYKSNGADAQPIAVTKVPFFDVELVGVPALAYVGRECFLENPAFQHLMGESCELSVWCTQLPSGRVDFGIFSQSILLLKQPTMKIQRW